MLRLYKAALTLAFALGLGQATRAAIPASALSDERAALGYLVVTHYPGVDPTGTTDSHAGIQEAIRDAHANDYSLYFPQGTYLVSDTLECYEYQLWNPTRNREFNPDTRRHQLVGENAGQRPVIKLASNASGFSNASDPRPVICFRNFQAQNSSATTPASPENPLKNPANFRDMQANLFNDKLQGIDFDLSGNPGAIAVVFPSAQNAALIDVNVNATGAFAGFYGLPGRNSITANVEVIGGDFGALVRDRGLGIPLIDGSAGINIAGARFIDQRVAAFNINDFVPTVVVGFHVEKKTSGPAIIVGHHNIYNGAGGTLCLIDGSIVLSENASDGLAIDNTDDRNLYIRNVYLSGTNRIVKSGTQAEVTETGAWKRVTEYAYNDQQNDSETDPSVYPDYPAGSVMYESRSLIDGTLSQAPEPIVNIEVNLTASNVPNDLLSRHLWDALPSFDDGLPYLNVTNAPYNAVPSDSGSDRAAIQSAIDDASAAGHGRVFLPRGVFRLDGTLTLKANTVLFGGGTDVTEIATTSGWRPTTGEPYMIETVDDPDATTFLGFVKINTPHNQPNATTPVDTDRWGHLKWRAGRASMTMRLELRTDWVHYASASNPKKTTLFTGGGGGRHYAFTPFTWADSHEDIRLISIEGTTEPLSFYGINVESTKNTGDTNHLYAFMDSNIEISNSSNIRIYGIKREGDSTTAIIDNSSNIAIYANGAMRERPVSPSKSYLVVRNESSDILIAGVGVQSISFKLDSDTEYSTLLDEVAIPTQSIPMPNMVSIYKRGSIDDSTMYQGPEYSNLHKWKNKHFGEGVNVDFGGNSDADPFTEIFEYAYGLDPFSKDPPESGLRFYPNQVPVSISFRRNTLATELDYKLQSSQDLITWTTLARSQDGSITNSTWNVAETAILNAEAINLVQLTAPENATEGSKLFLRLTLNDAATSDIITTE